MPDAPGNYCKRAFINNAICIMYTFTAHTFNMRIYIVYVFVHIYTQNILHNVNNVYTFVPMCIMWLPPFTPFLCDFMTKFIYFRRYYMSGGNA